MTARDPYSTPAADLDGGSTSALKLEPITVRYEIHYLPIAEQLAQIMKSRPGLIFGAMVAGGIALLFVRPIIGAVLAFIGGWILVKLALSVRRPPFGRPGETTRFELTMAAEGVTLAANDERHTYRWADVSHYDEQPKAAPTVLNLFLLNGRSIPVVLAALAHTEVSVLRAWTTTHLATRPKRAAPRSGPTKAVLLWVLLVLMFWAIYQIISKDSQPPPAP